MDWQEWLQTHTVAVVETLSGGRTCSCGRRATHSVQMEVYLSAWEACVPCIEAGIQRLKDDHWGLGEGVSDEERARAARCSTTRWTGPKQEGGE